MPHDLDLIITLTGAFTAALIFGYLTQRIRLSPIVGYLLAGIVVGPFTPGFVVGAHFARQLAELGVILLMFGVGLHFHVKDLVAVRRVAIPGALVQIAAATSLGVLITRAFGWSLGAGVVFGLSIAVASTVVLLRVLGDADALHTPAGHVAVGWLLVEDVFTVLVLVLLPILAGQASGGPGTVALAVTGATLEIAALIAFTLVVGRRTIPFLLAQVAKTRSRELFTLAVLVIVLGIAVGAAKLFGASMALGAFLAGMVVGQSAFSSRAASEALPMRDAFAVIFFVSMGMLLDPSQLVANAGLTALTLAVILVGKPLAALLVVLALRFPAKTAVSVAFALAQIGEFSFILVALGRRLDVLPERATQALVAAAIVSISLNPLLFRLVIPVANRLTNWVSRPARREEESAPPPHRSIARAIVVGHGPVGETLARLLREQGLSPTVVELNHETVLSLKKEGIPAIHGDASRADILESAGAKGAYALLFAASGSPDAVIRAAKDVNPELLILTRASYVREVAALKEAGADTVVSAEGEVAFAMAERLLTGLGATREQVDRARDRIRAELPTG